jgi:hypothetical protein
MGIIPHIFGRVKVFYAGEKAGGVFFFGLLPFMRRKVIP